MVTPCCSGGVRAAAVTQKSRSQNGHARATVRVSPPSATNLLSLVVVCVTRDDDVVNKKPGVKNENIGSSGF